MAQKTFSPISEAQIKKASIATLADRPNSVSRYGDGGLSAQELKQRFDAFPALVQKKINEIIEALASGEAAKYITLNEKSNVLQRDNLYDFIALFSEDTGDNETIADFIEAFYTMDGDMRPDSYSLKEIFADITARFATINADVSKVSSDIAAQSDRIATNEQKTQANAQNIASMQQAITERDTQISSHEERITGIERYLGGDNFIVDDSTAYEKTVPKNACEKAKVLSIAGMTYKKKTDEGNLMPYPYVGTGGLDYTVDKGAVTITGMDNDYVDFIISNGDGTVYPAGTYIFEVGEQSEYKVLSLSFNFSNYATVPGVTKRTNYKYLIASEGSFSITQFVAQIDGVETNITLYPMLYKSDTPITWQPRGDWLSHTKVKALRSESKNLLNLIGWSAAADAVVLSNAFGTAINSLEGNSITVSQSNYPAAENPVSFENGFFVFFPDKQLVNGKDYKISFDLKITNNPLDISYVHIVTNDNWSSDTRIDIPKTNAVQRCSGIITYYINPSFPNRNYFECRNCGVSFEIGNVMITEADVEDITYSPCGTLDLFTMPEAVQAREGYGEGINENYHNYIERTDDGRWLFHKRSGCVDIGTLGWNNMGSYDAWEASISHLNILEASGNYDEFQCLHPMYIGSSMEATVWNTTENTIVAKDTMLYCCNKMATPPTGILYYALAEPIVTDITDLMPKENLIRVLGDGRIVAENEHSDPVPFSIKYLVTYPKGG